MAVRSPVSNRLTVTALLLLTFATGLIDAVSVLVLGHVFVANMTGNVIFLGFWFVPHSGVDLTAALVAFVSFLIGAVIGGGWPVTSARAPATGSALPWASRWWRSWCWRFSPEPGCSITGTIRSWC